MHEAIHISQPTDLYDLDKADHDPYDLDEEYRGLYDLENADHDLMI